MALRLDRINRTWLMLFVAIIMALAAAWLTKQYLDVREKRIQEELASKAKGGPSAKVVVPRKNLPGGSAITSDMVAGRSIPADLVSPDMITPDNFDKYDGAKLIRNVERGLPLRTSDVEEKGRDFSSLIETGSRAITIDIDELNSIAQMVRPGNLVDLFLIMPDLSDLSGNNQQITLLMQRVKVIATGQTVRKADAFTAPQPGVPQGVIRYSNLTFEVSPDQAARIALAQQLGRIRAVLRKEPDEEIVKLGKINTKNLLKKVSVLDTPEEVDGGAVQYIIGGKGGGGVGNTISVNVPGMALPPGVPGVPATAAPAAAAAPALPSNIPAAALPYLQPQTAQK
ncbi:MAG: Flp pilus assembly protein CpaB [Burkholderiales bacterium]|jgi:pilus assembly protein CpaB|nr:Flp pilus assembly protein CpaB [Burkholderiales bacterium]